MFEGVRITPGLNFNEIREVTVSSSKEDFAGISLSSGITSSSEPINLLRKILALLEQGQALDLAASNLDINKEI